MMAVTLRQHSASTSSILIWGFPSIIEISVRKYKIRLISEVLVNSVRAYDNTNKVCITGPAGVGLKEGLGSIRIKG
jgi:hypothetical protein